MTDHEVPDDAAERLFETLDELTGIDPSSDLEQELRDADPVPLSPGFAERLRAELEASGARHQDSSGHRPLRRTWWIAASISLCLIACVAYVFDWSGRRSTRELGFEHALEVVQDANYPEHSRHAAFIAAAAHIKTGIDSVKSRARTSPQLAPDAELLLTALQATCDGSTKARGKRLERGTFRSAVNELDYGADAAAKTALPIFQLSVEYGLRVLDEARALGPRFERDYASQISKIRRRLE